MNGNTDIRDLMIQIEKARKTAGTAIFTESGTYSGPGTCQDFKLPSGGRPSDPDRAGGALPYGYNHHVPESG